MNDYKKMTTFDCDGGAKVSNPTRAVGKESRGEHAALTRPSFYYQMLPSTGLFRKLTCPYYPNCPRITCIYSHDAPPSAQGIPWPKRVPTLLFNEALPKSLGNVKQQRPISRTSRTILVCLFDTT